MKIQKIFSYRHLSRWYVKMATWFSRLSICWRGGSLWWP